MQIDSNSLKSDVVMTQLLKFVSFQQFIKIWFCNDWALQSCFFSAVLLHVTYLFQFRFSVMKYTDKKQKFACIF